MSNISISDKINNIAEFLRGKINLKPQIGLILGSGLGNLLEDIEDKLIIPYADIPHLPKATAPGHIGNFIAGKINNKSVVAMQGRLHIYEGHSPQDATLLIRAMKKLGVNILIITAAAGSLNRQYNTGEIMLITDHVGFHCPSPLIGANLDEFGPRFPVMFDIYTPDLQDVAIKAALKKQIRLNKGVYGMIPGPNYTTRSELQVLIDYHCDAVGMSVVHEAIVAAHSNMKIIGFAALTDSAQPSSEKHTTEQEVIESGKRISVSLKALIAEIIHDL